MQKMLLRVICVCVLLIILTAGLWPFHAPRNDVSWLSQGNGLRFGKHGAILSANPFAANELRADKACSLEIWLEPNLSNSSGTVLAFYWPASKVVSFSLRQWRDGLVLERQSHGHATEASIYVADVFRGPSPVVFAISSGEAGAAIYVDGTLVRNFPDFKLTSRDLSGELIVGNGPLTTNNWSGQIKGLAVYDRGLLPAEVAQDHANWTAAETIGVPPDPAERESMVARFRFDEGKGHVVHNQVDPSTNLLIPERFFVFHEQFLELPWDEFQAGWHYWRNVAINVVGFIPLGFFFQAYFSAVGKIKRATRLTIVLGFLVSLTIEVLQAFLPTRDSGVTDLITNTFGTALGATLCVWSIKHNCFAQAGLSIGSSVG